MNIPIIHILSEHEARKIAAGEVVERPASVVKELLENALDAGATEITVTIGDGGRSHIHIRDNGSGMSPEDVHLCIEHHATSKIKTVDELTSITTFGFRGEALSSIASVSKLTIRTRRPHDTQGYELSIHFGTLFHAQPASTQVGTSIVVDNLFENVPARRKFLKQRETEWRAIQQLVTAYALAYPQIGFTLQHDGIVTFTAPRTPHMLARAQQLFDRELGERLIAIEGATGNGHVHIEGFVSDHQYARYDRRAIFFFVNKRWVKNYTLGKAILNGYQNVLPQAKYPCVALALTIPSDQVDINIHPRKEEVLLLHPQLISRAIEKAVSEALATRVSSFITSPRNSHQHDIPARTRTSPADQLLQAQPWPTWHDLNVQSTVESTTEHQKTVGPLLNEPNMRQLPPISSQNEQLSVPKEAIAAEKDAFVQHVLPRAAGLTIEPSIVHTMLHDVSMQYELIGQVHATYIIIETAEGLMMLDQHAAHESVLYYQLQHHAHVEEPTKLLFIEHISIVPEHQQFVSMILSELAHIGVIAEQEGDRLSVHATTHHFKKIVLQECVNGMLQILEEEAKIESAILLKKLRHATYAMIACKAAVKAGDALSLDEMKSLIQVFLKTPERLTCPHGRPTSWMVSTTELARRFQRT